MKQTLIWASIIAIGIIIGAILSFLNGGLFVASRAPVDIVEPEIFEGEAIAFDEYCQSVRDEFLAQCSGGNIESSGTCQEEGVRIFQECMSAAVLEGAGNSNP